MLMLFLALGCLVAPCCAAGDTIFFDGFEAENVFDRWEVSDKAHSSAWLSHGARSGFGGTSGISIAPRAAKEHHLFQSVRWPADSRRMREGVYFSFNFRVHISADRAVSPEKDPYLTLFIVDLAAKSGAYFSSPIVLLGSESDTSFYLTMTQRGKKEDNPQIMEASGLARSVSSETWHTLGVFMRLRGDTLVDTLFLDTRAIGSKQIVFADMPGLIQSWRIGPDRATTLPVGSVDFDDMTVVEGGRESLFLRPVITAPVANAYLTAAAPLFSVKEAHIDSLCAWIQITIDSSGKTMMDSLFSIPGPYAFGRLLPENGLYSFKARYVEKTGVKRPWSRLEYFYVGRPGRGEESLAGDSNVIMLRPSRSGGNIFSAGDTAVIAFRYPAPAVHYVDLGVRAESFAQPVSDRFGVFDSTQNYVFSLNPDGTVFSKYSHGSNEWVVVDSAVAHRRARVGDSMAFSLPINAAMTPGIWTVNAALITEQPSSISGFPKLFFVIKDPDTTHGTRTWPIVVSGMALLAGLGVVAARRKRVAPEQLPPAWVSLCEDVEAFLQKNYADKELSRLSISEQMHLEDRKLAEIFQRVKGKSPLQRLRDIRMEKACELLQKSVISISEVAYQVGFDDPLVFQRNFKKMYGTTPSQYRKQP